MTTPGDKYLLRLQYLVATAHLVCGVILFLVGLFGTGESKLFTDGIVMLMGSGFIAVGAAFLHVTILQHKRQRKTC